MQRTPNRNRSGLVRRINLDENLVNIDDEELQLLDENNEANIQPDGMDPLDLNLQPNGNGQILENADANGNGVRNEEAIAEEIERQMRRRDDENRILRENEVRMRNALRVQLQQNERFQLRIQQLEQMQQNQLRRQRLQQQIEEQQRVEQQQQQINQQQQQQIEQLPGLNLNQQIGVNIQDNLNINREIFKHLSSLKDCKKVNCLGFLQALENALNLFGDEYEQIIIDIAKTKLENTLQFSISHINEFDSFSRVIMNTYLPTKTLTQVRQEMSNLKRNINEKIEDFNNRTRELFKDFYNAKSKDLKEKMFL